MQQWLAEQEYSDVQFHRKIDFDILKTDQNELGTATPAGLTCMITAVFQQNHLTPVAC
ncbi:MAG: hypothetical protein GY805_02080 [Chloroflexi bacterium]|nr:hypothetical protein [Chloroflexota bacterium]